VTAANDYLALQIYSPVGAGISADALVVNGSGNVGVGTTNPGSALQVNGGVSIGYSVSTATTSNGLQVKGNVGIGGVNSQAIVDIYANQTASNMLYLQNTNTSYGTLITFPLGWLGEYGASYAGSLYGIAYASMFRVTGGSNTNVVIDGVNVTIVGSSSVSINYRSTSIAQFGYGGTGITFPLLAPGSGTALFKINTSGLLTSALLNQNDITQAPTVSAPSYVKGSIYFDTTLNKMRIGGASGWETVTSA
jgi:hypothetical protein